MDNTTSSKSIFQVFSEEYYGNIHIALIALICCLGIPCQIMMLIVLGTKGIFSPTNLLLMSLSGSQLFLLLNNLYIIFYRFVADELCVEQLWNYSWVFALLLNVNFSVVFHTIAVFHVVALSVVRYVSIGFFARRQTPWFTQRRAWATAVSLYASVILLCVPFYVNCNVKRETAKPICGRNNVTAHELAFSDGRLSVFNYWLLAVMGKFVPCCVLLIMSFLLVYELNKLRQMSHNLLKGGKERRSVRAYSGTTKMILMVMCLFLAVELPQGVLTLSAGISNRFTQRVYRPLGDFFEMLTLLYSSVNFVLFCSMSSPFRANFRRTFCSCCADEPGAEDNGMERPGRSMLFTSMMLRMTMKSGTSKFNSPNSRQSLAPSTGRPTSVHSTKYLNSLAKAGLSTQARRHAAVQRRMTDADGGGDIGGPSTSQKPRTLLLRLADGAVGTNGLVKTVIQESPAPVDGDKLQERRHSVSDKSWHEHVTHV